MSETQYAIPAAGGGDKLPLADLIGALLRIDVVEQVMDVQTTFGLTNPIRCNVAVLDGAKKAETFDDTLIFPRAMISQLKPKVGEVVVARLGKGVAKAGQSAPWLLEAPTEEDIAVARKYDAYVAEQTAKTAEPF
jgi:hypothetical protein